MDYLMNFWNTVLTQRNWSWAVIGLAYLMVFLLIRSFFLHQLIRRARALNSKWFQEVKKIYAKNCAGGWVLFMVSFLMVIFFWQRGNVMEPSLYELGMVFLILLTLLLSILSTVIAFGLSVIQVLKQLENNQMTL